MPVLKNARHERFAQELAKGKTADEAYQQAGFKANRGNATTLKHKESIQKRVAEIIKREDDIDRKALEKAAERLSITKERVLKELGRIGFADIRKAVRWGEGVAVVDHETKEVRIANGVALVGSEEIDDETAAAIAEVSQTKEGLKVKFHDKKAALVDIGKHLGMFKDDAVKGDMHVTVNIAGSDEKLL